MLLSSIFSSYPSEEGVDLVADTNNKYLEVLVWCRSKMLEYLIQTRDGIETYKSVARIDKWFHCLVHELVFIPFH